MAVDDPEVLEPYVATPMATSFDEDNKLMTRQDYNVLNTKLDTLFRHAQTFST